MLDLDEAARLTREIATAHDEEGFVNDPVAAIGRLLPLEKSLAVALGLIGTR